MKITNSIKILFISFFCLIQLQIIHAQSKKESDSLKYLLKTAKHDTTKIKIRIEIGEFDNILRIGYFDSIRIDCEKILKINQKKEVNITTKKYLANSLNDIGYIYQNKGNILIALEYYNKCLKISEEIGDKQGIANSLNNIGSISKNQGNISKALEYYNKSLKISEKIGDKLSTANTLNNIGSIYKDQGDKSKALEYYNKSLIISEEIGDKQDMICSLNNIGYIYQDYSIISKALECYKKGLILSEEIGDNNGIVYSNMSIGSIFFFQAKEAKSQLNFVSSDSLIKKALEYCDKSLKLSEEIGDKQQILTSLMGIGMIYLFQNNILSAKTYAIKAHTIAIELGFPFNIERSAELLKNLYLKTDNYKQAFEYFKLEIKMQDSVSNDDNFKNIQKQQAKYEYDKKAAVDSIAYSKAMEIKNLKIGKQKVVIYSFVGGFIIILILLFIIIFQRNKLGKQKLQLENRQIIIDHENTQLKIKNIETENQQLKQQIQPHFLFNSLNILKTLIKKDCKVAEEYIINLSNFLRVSISSGNINVVTIKEELKFCMDYLEMQKIRYGEALQYNICIHEEIQNSGSVPIFSIQQLLENSIKHNILTDKKPIYIKIYKEEERIIVSNNLQKKYTQEVSTGIGLKNISERYKILSGDEVIINNNDNEFSVSIKIINN